MSKALALGWVTINKSQGAAPTVCRKVEKIEDVVKEHLQAIASGQDIAENLKQDYKKRKLIIDKYVFSYYNTYFLYIHTHIYLHFCFL